jgi:hypothetical protein
MARRLTMRKAHMLASYIAANRDDSSTIMANGGFSIAMMSPGGFFPFEFFQLGWCWCTPSGRLCTRSILKSRDVARRGSRRSQRPDSPYLGSPGLRGGAVQCSTASRQFSVLGWPLIQRVVVPVCTAPRNLACGCKEVHEDSMSRPARARSLNLEKQKFLYIERFSNANFQRNTNSQYLVLGPSMVLSKQYNYYVCPQLRASYTSRSTCPTLNPKPQALDPETVGYV